MTGPRAMRFLGVERELADAEDWNRPDWPKLWLYNAHYFDDLTAPDAPARLDWHRDLVRRWVGENPPGKGNGWEPYPVSLRIVNWIKWSWAGNPLDPTASNSLAVQARHLRKRLEIHLLGNHLWANAKALVFAGVYFEGDEGASWLRKGASLVERELAEQVLADGGHFERSPMYHAIVLEDVLDLLQLDRMYPGVLPATLVARLRERVGHMLHWLRVMSHPDGDIALFNDAALGIAPPLAALESYACALDVPFDTTPLARMETLAESGYVRMSAGAAVLIADVGPVGPDYLPGHAHADTLSFELSLHGRRVLVNGGTSTYESGPQRMSQRGTAMHNTVQVDGQDSSEVWAAFRVARRARPVGVSATVERGALVLQASHDGYLRLPGRVLHTRRWILGEGGLEVVDTLSGTMDEAVARFRLAPGFEGVAGSGAPVADRNSLGGCMALGDIELGWHSTARVAASVSGAWYPRFGEQQPCQVLECRIDGGGMSTEFRWK